LIRLCTEYDFDSIYETINDAARAYRGIIPADRYSEPYMSYGYLQHELTAGVVFWAHEVAGEIVGVMGIQDILDVTLIRHAYVRTSYQNQGIGGKLISHLMTLTSRPTLVGTWAAAVQAIRFYEKYGFRLVAWEEKERLLRKYWSIPERQTQTSVVLADQKWFDLQSGG